LTSGVIPLYFGRMLLVLPSRKLVLNPRMGETIDVLDLRQAGDYEVLPEPGRPSKILPNHQQQLLQVRLSILLSASQWDGVADWLFIIASFCACWLL
jgi:hypothetical protein